jgi:hypothetical protein
VDDIMSALDDHSYDNDQALKEGWSVFHVNRAPNHEFEIERIDDPSELHAAGTIDYAEPIFKDDHEAMTFVVDQARSGSDYHMGALTFLRERSPSEFLSMSKDYDLAFLSASPRPFGP